MTWNVRLLAVCLALAAAPSAFGGFVVSIGNATIQQGQSNAIFSVTLASSDGSPIGVNSFGFELLAPALILSETRRGGPARSVRPH